MQGRVLVGLGMMGHLMNYTIKHKMKMKKSHIVKKLKKELSNFLKEKINYLKEYAALLKSFMNILKNRK